MIQLEKIPNKNIYKFTVDGSIDEKGIHEFTDLLVAKEKENHSLKIIGVVNQFPKIENFATFKEMVKLKFEAISGIGKYAILSDKKWLATLVPVADFLTPKTPIKVFEMDEEEEAIKWLETDTDTTA